MKVIRQATQQGIASRVADILRHPILEDLCVCLEQGRNDNGKTELAVLQAPSPSTAAARLAKYFGEDNMRHHVLSELNVTIGEVEDVVPATDFQASAISAGMLNTRGYSNYLQIDLEGHVRSDAIKSALHHLLAAHSIMRTAFIPYRNQLFQVVLSQGELDFEELELHGESLEASMKDWVNEDLKKPSLLKTATLRAVVIRSAAHSASQAAGYRLLLQLSHACYDGTCLPTLVDDLAAALKGKPTQSRSNFADYAHYVAEQNADPQAQSFWRKHLKGSKMTQLMPSAPEGIARIVDSTVSRTIEYKPVQSDGTSFASLLQAAWAVVLSRITGNDDVVFGHLVSGRNNMLPQIETVMGACINIIPVRVRVESHVERLGADVLAQVKEQYASSLPFETVGCRTVVEKCTSWPTSTRFSTIVQHQNLAVEDACGSGAPSYKLHTPDHDSCDVWIISIPKERETTLHFNYASDSISLATAEALLDILIDVIRQLADSTHDLARGTVLPSTISHWINRRELDPLPTSPLSHANTSNPVVKIHECVKEAWKHAFGIKIAGGLNTPFYDIPGGLIAVNELQTYYQSIGYPLTIEDLYRQPTMTTQTALVYDKLYLHKGVNGANGMNFAK
jgi:hypothetical protein